MRLLVSAGFPWMIDLVKHLQPEEIIASTPEVAASLASADLPAVPLAVPNGTAAVVEVGRYLRQAGQVIDDSPQSAFVLRELSHLAFLVIGLDATKPDCMILHNDVEPLFMLAALWAQARDVPCFHVPHAIYLMHPWRGRLGEDVHDLVTASHLAAASPYQATWYEQLSDRLAIQLTGSPRWDSLPKDLRITREQARLTLGLRANDFAILYATSWGQRTSQSGRSIDPFQYFLAFLESAKSWQIPQQTLLVKLHPNQRDGQRYAEALHKSGLKGLITATHLPILLRAADRLISFGPSNICLEGWAFGLAPIVHGCPPPWAGSWADSQIPVETLMSPIAVELGDYIGFLDGKAGERIATWIRQTCH